ncbi:hypothetical protein [Mycolicibacterium mageritense]|uniref:Uncharacterized protein n=1 Tax=Mycolicibacterium mageritense TaxID=53462 RepID=A0AAI8XSA7_MYCME|nr:hypothetical protein [Mycolicibacterium mageritense]BDY32996.1 hypothetical protein hbim_06968 [Mycolicibacterium mageritense]
MSGTRRSLLIGHIPDGNGEVEVRRTQGGNIRLSRSLNNGGVAYFTLGIDACVSVLDAVVDYLERVEDK